MWESYVVIFTLISVWYLNHAHVKYMINDYYLLSQCTTGFNYHRTI
jgi:hypothetical protein